MSTREKKINEAIIDIRMAQAVIEFAMESGKFESKIVMDDMQDQSDGLDHVAQLLMDIRDGKDQTAEEENAKNARRAIESEEVPTDKGAINAMKRVRNYCATRPCSSCVFYSADNHCAIANAKPVCFRTREELEEDDDHDEDAS